MKFIAILFSVLSTLNIFDYLYKLKFIKIISLSFCNIVGNRLKTKIEFFFAFSEIEYVACKLSLAK